MIVMHHFRLLIALFGVSIAPVSLARADSIDLTGWTQRFAEAAAKSDVEGMAATLDEVKDPRLNLTQVKSTLEDFIKVKQGESALYAEQISDEKVGTVFDRVTVAAVFKTMPLFYTMTFMREDGWKLVFLQFNSDYNKVTHLDWMR